MPCRATQDWWVIVESDKTWSTGEGNCKPLQHSCLENPINSMKRQKHITNLDRVLKSRDIPLLTKVHLVKAMVFSSIHVQMWELDHQEGWELKNRWFQTVMLQKSLGSTLYCKEIKPVNPKGNQSWIFTGRTDAEAEAPILRPSDAKSQLIGKDLDVGKDWRQKMGTTEDKMIEWHHQLNGHEFEQTPGHGEEQANLDASFPGVAKNWTRLSDWTTTITTTTITISPLCSSLMYSIAILCLATSYSVEIQHIQVNFFTQIGLSILTLPHMIAIFLILVNFLSYILKFLWKYFLNTYIKFYLMEVAKSPSWFLFFFSLSFFLIIIIFFWLYNIVLVWPYINMHPPWLYMCSPQLLNI